jgi:rSAM/selenodomain-associated transferase 1
VNKLTKSQREECSRRSDSLPGLSVPVGAGIAARSGQRKLIDFLKAPRPGWVNTRLAGSLGIRSACEAYRRLVETLLDQLGELREIELRFAPDDALEEIRPWIREGWAAAPQGPGTLGQRLERAFREAFSAGLNRVVIIGSDCPAVTMDDINSAWRALDSHPVVVGPAQDGGYWLIGLSAPRRELLENISWSTDKVLRQTLERARQSGARVRLLRELADVDTPEDWDQFLKGLDASVAK